VSCRRLIANFTPQTGQIETVNFMSDVVFISGTQKGTAGLARFGRETNPDGVLMMTKDPEIVDQEQGSRLRARRSPSRW
jgi:hypothetical protein